MQLTIIAIGTRGDVQPYLALGQGLSRAGHTVRVATHQEFEGLVEGLGLEFFLLRGSPSEFMQGPAMRSALEKGENTVIWIRRLLKTYQAEFVQGMAETWDAGQGADALIFSMFGQFLGSHVAEKLGIPFFPTDVVPTWPTGAFTSPLLPFELRLGGAVNWLSHAGLTQAVWQLLRPILNKARREVLALPPSPFLGPFRSYDRDRRPMLHGYSPLVLPRDPGWPAWHHITGYWTVDSQDIWEPPADLAAFLDSGPPPVYVGFGSMTSRDPAYVTAAVLAALQQTGQRGLLMTGWDGIGAADLPDDVFLIESAPHDWLFPRMAAVVHHGGAGTTAAGLRAGVPSVLVPFNGDQFFWGRCVGRLGVGPKPVHRKRLTAEKLADAIQAATGDESIGRAAAALGEKIRAEDGVGRAVAIIEAVMSRA